MKVNKENGVRVNEVHDRKFCKDCKYHVFDYSTGCRYCSSPNVSNEYNFVTGSLRMKECHIERYDNFSLPCGPDAKCFEPKEAVIPWYIRIFKKE